MRRFPKKAWQFMGGVDGSIPSSVPGLQFWFAAWKETAYADAAEVNSPTDFSGNGVVMTSPSGVRRPLYKTNIINGQPVFRFDGTNDCWQGTKANFDFLHTGSNTLFFIVKQSVSSSAYLYDSSNGVSPTNIGRTIRMLGTNGNYVDNGYAGSTPNDVWAIQSPNGTLPVGDWSIIVNRYTQGNTGDDFENWIDSEPRITDQGTLSPSASTSTGLPTIGATSGLGNPLNGDLAEVFAYNRALTNTEINQLVGGLSFGL